MMRMVLRAVLCALVSCNAAIAQDYPNRPVKVILSNSAGGSPDIIMRVVADGLSKSLGQQFFIENRPGGESMIGAELASRAAPDGYTLYLGANDAMVANRFRLKSLTYDPDKAFTPIANIIDSAPFVVALHPDVPARTFGELVSVAKAQSGKLSYGFTIGISDILGRWINKIAGIDLLRVPYRQNPQAVQDALTGQVQVLLISLPSVQTFVDAGKLRIVAVSSAKRFPSLPGTPTIAETYPGLIIEGWFALFGPTGIPPEVVRRLNPEVGKVLRDPEVVKRIRSYGFSSSGGMTPEWVLEHMREDIARWRRIAQDIGLQPQ
jgi:tripartite-type tricarboxylate transporter receptor subunit TctC